MNDTQARQLGLRLVEFLGLKALPQTEKQRVTGEVRYTTDWGSKTIEGLGRCIQRMVDEAKNNS